MGEVDGTGWPGSLRRSRPKGAAAGAQLVAVLARDHVADPGRVAKQGLRGSPGAAARHVTRRDRTLDLAVEG